MPRALFAALLNYRQHEKGIVLDPKHQIIFQWLAIVNRGHLPLPRGMFLVNLVSVSLYLTN